MADRYVVMDFSKLTKSEHFFGHPDLGEAGLMFKGSPPRVRGGWRYALTVQIQGEGGPVWKRDRQYTVPLWGVARIGSSWFSTELTFDYGPGLGHQWSFDIEDVPALREISADEYQTLLPRAIQHWQTQDRYVYRLNHAANLKRYFNQRQAGGGRGNATKPPYLRISTHKGALIFRILGRQKVHASDQGILLLDLEPGDVEVTLTARRVLQKVTSETFQGIRFDGDRIYWDANTPHYRIRHGDPEAQAHGIQVLQPPNWL